MSRQNRVTPEGEFIATSARGTFLGNRGILHDADGRIQRTHTHPNWVICLLVFKERRRIVMAPGRYTELFFLDEVTALAAGHRPCGECRRAAYRHFTALWQQANPELLQGEMFSPQRMDRALHRERINARSQDKRVQKITFQASLDELPDGAFVRGVAGESLLVLDDRLLLWTPEGYTDSRPRPVRQQVTVLTPRSTVGVLSTGYLPILHPSAG